MLLRWLLPVLLTNRPTNGRAVQDLAKTAAIAAQRCVADAASDDDKEAAVFANRRVEETDGDTDQVQSVWTQMAMFK